MAEQPPIRLTRSTGVPSPAGSKALRVEAERARAEDDVLRRGTRSGPRSGSSRHRRRSRRGGWARSRRTARPRPRQRPRSCSTCSRSGRCSAMAIVASRVSKPGKAASSKPPSGCCCAVNQETAASAAATDAGGTDPRGERDREERCCHRGDACSGTTNVRHVFLRGPFPRGPVSAALLNGVRREHRWPGGQRQVAWLAECGGVPQCRSQLRVSVGLAPTSPVPGPEPGNRTQHPGCAQPLSRGHVSPT